MARHGIRHTSMQISVAKIWCKTAPEHGDMAPDTWNETRNMKLGTWNDLWLCKACIIWTWSVKTESRQSQNKHIYSFKQGQTMDTNRTKLACKNGPVREVMKQVAAAGPKWPRALQKSLRGTQYEALYSLQQATDLNKNRPKTMCKKWTKRET